jgi:hypothetical protein
MEGFTRSEEAGRAFGTEGFTRRQGADRARELVRLGLEDLLDGRRRGGQAPCRLRAVE